MTSNRRRAVDFVLILHAHLPYVLRHGRWPHGTDWLMEAAIDSYLPLIDRLRRLGDEGIDAPMTISVTPVLAEQITDPAFAGELRAFLTQRLDACDEAERELSGGTNDDLVADVRYWRAWSQACVRQFGALDGGIAGALRSLENEGRVVLMSSAATHGFLPLLARDESIDLQLAVGRDVHRRVFGRAPAGCWLPECAYRPRGRWAPSSITTPRLRDGIEDHVVHAGYRFVVIDAHLARAGHAFNAYARRAASSDAVAGTSERSPYGNYTIGGGPHALRALVRDPVSTRQVWSRDGGYTGGGSYLEFHKLRFPGGLRLWEVTGSGVSLGEKGPYQPDRAGALADEHARHFADVLGGVADARRVATESVIVAPFDAELFGHWWFEGPRFLEGLYRAMRGSGRVHPATASGHMRAFRTAEALELPAGSWGRDGDFSFWLNDQTSAMWHRMWELEDRFWNAAPGALSRAGEHRALAQAARELLLAQASDWQFMMTAGEVADYGERRFALHADAADSLVSALERGGDVDGGARLAEELRARDGLFPDILDAVARVAMRAGAAR